MEHKHSEPALAEYKVYGGRRVETRQQQSWTVRARGLRVIQQLVRVGAVGVLLGAACVHAQLFKWTDEKGVVHYSDKVPPSANDRARAEIRPDGVVKSTMERMPTLEERKLLQAQAEERARLRAEQDEQARKDKALLSTYIDVAAHDRSRERTLSIIESDIKVLAEREASLLKGGKSKKEDKASDLNRIQELLHRRQADRERMVKHYDTERARLSALLSAEEIKPPTASAKP